MKTNRILENCLMLLSVQNYMLFLKNFRYIIASLLLILHTYLHYKLVIR